MIDISNSKLFEILPASIRNDEDIRAAAIAVDRSTGDIYSFSRKLDFRSNKDVKDHEILDELAIDLHVDFYDKNLHADMKREIIDNSIIQHMERGTAGAVERTLANIGITSEVIEWSEYGGNPFYFKVQIPLEEHLNQNDKKLLKKLIDSYKNTRSHLDAIVFKEYLLLSFKLTHYMYTRIKMQTNSNPWAQAGLGNTADVILLDGEYLLDGNRFLNGFYNKDGPAHMQKIKLTSKVLHEFGVHEVNIMPSLDGEFNLDGGILLQNEPQNKRLVILHDARMRNTQREVIAVSSQHSVPIKASSVVSNGVASLDGQVNLDGTMSLDQALYNHGGLFRVKKDGETVEEVAI